MKDDFISPARANTKTNLKGVKYRSLEDRVWTNNFDAKKVERHVPKIEKEIDKKVKRVGEFVRETRPPSEKVEYKCDYCNSVEERYESEILTMQSRAGSYQCRDCIAKVAGKSRRRKKK